MSLPRTLSVGFGRDPKPRLPFERLLAQHDRLRDAAAGHAMLDRGEDLWPFVALASFTYVFNAYKALGLILPQLYHESGAVLLRQIWEASMNLHWMEKDGETRAQDFCNFTLMESRKMMKKSDQSSAIKEFDEATKTFQQRFHFLDRRNRPQVYTNFSGDTVADRARELGDPWKSDYDVLYHLASMHAHGAPGAVLHAHFVQSSDAPDTRERDSTALIAYLSMRVLVADCDLLVRNGIFVASPLVQEIFREALSDESSTKKDQDA